MKLKQMKLLRIHKSFKKAHLQIHHTVTSKIVVSYLVTNIYSNVQVQIRSQKKGYS